MEYELTRHERADCLQLILHGQIHSDDLKTLISILSEDVIEKNENCVLLDSRKTSADYSELEMINFLRNFPPKLRALKIAVLVDKHKTKSARLYESIVYSNGFPIRFFTGEEKALAYIKP